MASSDDKMTGPLFDLWCRAYSICREHAVLVSVEHLASEALRLSDNEFSERAELMRAMAYDGMKPKAKRFLGRQVHAEVIKHSANASGQLELDGVAYPFAPLEMVVVRSEQTFVIPTPDATFDEISVLHSRLIAEAHSKTAAAEDLDRLSMAIHGRAIVLMISSEFDGDSATSQP